METVGPLDYIGPDNLPKGWHRPTHGMAERLKLYRSVQCQIAQPSSWWLRGVKAISPPEKLPSSLQQDIKLMVAHVGSNTTSPIDAAGMAHQQLLGASRQRYRVIVIPKAAKDIKTKTLREPVVYIDPVIEPVQEAGQEVLVESCFSCPGAAREVRRWKKVWLHSRNHESVLLEGVLARVAQHEVDHLDGILYTDRGREQGFSIIYFVPTDLISIFYGEYVEKGRLRDWPYTFKPEQFEAMMNGRFSFDNYFRYL